MENACWYPGRRVTFVQKKSWSGQRKSAETFTFCEKEIAKLYTATSFRLNTSLYLEFNWNILKEKQIMFWYKIFLHFRFAKILHSQLSLTKDGKCLLISWKTSHFCSEKKLIGPKKIAETFTFCEKEIAELYTATSFRLNTSLCLEFNWNILKEKLNSFNLNSTFGRDEAL